MAGYGRRGGIWLWTKRTLGAVAIVVALALVAAVVVALIPVSTGGLGSTPDPATSHAAAVERFEERAAAEREVRLECRSSLLDEGERAERVVVLFHGLTNCPRQMRELAERLHAEGATVLVLRAPDHGLRGDVGEIGDVDAEDLRDYADDAVDIAAGLGDEVTVMGLSLGGTLAAWAAEERDEVDRAVVVAPALEVGGVPGFVGSGFTNLFSRLPNLKLPSGGVQLPHALPPAIATHPSAQLFRLGNRVVEQAGDTAPRAASLAVVVNDNDRTISNDRVDELFERWKDAGASVTRVLLPRSLGLPHDVVDIAQPKGRTDVVYPVLLALAEGKTPPRVTDT